MFQVKLFELGTNQVLISDEYLSETTAYQAYLEDKQACESAGIECYGYVVGVGISEN